MSFFKQMWNRVRLNRAQMILIKVAGSDVRVDRDEVLMICGLIQKIRNENYPIPQELKGDA